MNNLSDYDPRWCDGHFCPKDCDCYPYRAENTEKTFYITHWMPLPEPPKEETGA